MVAAPGCGTKTVGWGVSASPAVFVAFARHFLPLRSIVPVNIWILVAPICRRLRYVRLS